MTRPGPGGGRTGREQRGAAAVTAVRWLPCALTGHDDLDDVSSGRPRRKGTPVGAKGQDNPDAAAAQDLNPDRGQAPAPDHRRAPHLADSHAREHRGRAGRGAQQ